MPKIDTVKDNQSGIEVPIYLDKKTLVFSASFGDFRTQGSDGHKVRADVMAAIRERAALKWTPVIKARQTHNITSVQADGEEKRIEDREEMGLRIERFYAAQKFDGQWIRVNWRVDPENRMTKAAPWYEMKPTDTEIRYSSSSRERYPDFKNEGDFILPYDENLWRGLTEIIRQMKRIRELVSGLLGSEEGISRLIAVGSDVPLLESVLS